MSLRHCICAALGGASLMVSSAAAQQTPRPEFSSGPAASPFTIRVGGRTIGGEQVSVTRTAEGWTIASSGRVVSPVEVIWRRVELRYSADWKPIAASIDATIRGQIQTVRTTVEGGTAKNDITVAGQPNTKSDPIDPAAVFLANPIFAPYEAVAARLRTAAAGSTIPVYIVPQASLTLNVGESTPEQIQTASRLIQARRTRVTLAVPNAPLDIEVVSDEAGRLLRVNIPSQSLEVARDDIIAVSARQVTISRANDEQVRIPANGFVMAGTVSKPAAATGPLPAIVLTGGAGPTDRDELQYGIPIFGELAGALADAGFLVLRYDKRGVGQSGGRVESATLPDFADDQRAAVKFLADRKDVDRKRIAVAGHSEGGVVSLLSASRDNRIAAVVLLATPGIGGSELTLAQQKRLLDRSTLSEADKQSKIELQKQINQAVMTGKGLDKLPADVRRQADDPWFQSYLTTDPGTIIPKVRQPILIVQGDLDTQVEPANADRIAAAARARKNATPVEVVKVPGVNHLLVPATTGEIDEYTTLKDAHVSPAVTGAVVDWLKKTLK